MSVDTSSSNDIPITLENMQSLSLSKDEVLVVTIDEKYPTKVFHKMADAIRANLKEMFPFKVHVLVVPSTVNFSKISAEDATAEVLSGNVQV